MRGPAAALALGLLHAAAFSPPLQHWGVSLAALAGLFALMHARAAHGAGTGEQALLAGAFGLGWFGAGLAWLYVSMHVYGGMPSPMAAVAVVLFAAYLALYPAAASALAWRVAPRRGPLPMAAALAGAWTLAELARARVLTGFPWLAPGYAQLDGPIDGWAPIGGVHAVGAVALLLAALAGTALAAAVRARTAAAGVVPMAVAVLLVAASALLPGDRWTRPHGEPLQVRLVQGNVPQEMKFRPERVLAAMNDYAARFESGRATLTVLPETAWTVPWRSTPEPIARRILEHAARGHAIAIGMPLSVPGDSPARPRLANSVLLLTPQHARDPAGSPAPRYDKRHLVPFGEFVPWGFGWFVAMMDIPLGEFARGAVGQPPFEVGGQRIAFNVCYEDLFGNEIREALPGSSGATVLANVSNIAWFGRSHALPQHLAIARMRTRETGRPMLRATNTGVTAAIDAQGRVLARLEPYVAGEIDVAVQGTTGLTPYARFGDLPALLAAIALLAASALRAPGGAGRTR
jgi:apolipoprotein N-acyltransferase